RTFATAESFDAVFKQTLEILSQKLKARYYGVFWLNAEGDAFEFRHGKGYKPGLMSAIPVSGSLMGECLYEKRVVWEPKLRERSDHIPLNQEPAEYNVLCAPLVLLGKDTGVVRLANIDPASVEAGRRVLEDVQPLLVASLERLLLYQRTERARKGLEASLAISKLLEDTLVEREILKTLGAQVPRLFKCAACVIAILDQQRAPKPVFSYPDGFAIGGSPASSTVYLGNLLLAFPQGAGLVEEIHRDKRWSWPEARARSLCCAPLRIRGMLRGTIIALSPPDETYDASHASILRLAAAQTSMTLERAAHLRQQEDLARLDGLTGLLNHRVFQETVREEVERCRRYGRPLSLVMLDIDHFKRFNDTHGHPVGDEVLRMVARTLRGFIRRTDKAFRYGGEEFCLLLPETILSNAALISDRLRQKIAKNRTVRNLSVTISLGVAELGAGGGAESLVERADQALYRSKEAGRNRVSTAS
ncbi:MAG: diguanylate cyclase, partial [Chitinivibrionales bacterium]|nr:diguanylate cyclase [Chitinivibrionales bacterium]MBD3395367.1 diguanylate cyclase [Chitinivibrionales bacterium]